MSKELDVFCNWCNTIQETFPHSFSDLAYRPLHPTYSNLPVFKHEKGKDDNEIIYRLNLPGFEKEDVKVTIYKNTLKVRAENKDETLIEISEGLSRKPEDMDAELKNGVLRIRISFKPEEIINIEVK